MKERVSRTFEFDEYDAQNWNVNRYKGFVSLHGIDLPALHFTPASLPALRMLVRELEVIRNEGMPSTTPREE